MQKHTMVLTISPFLPEVITYAHPYFLLCRALSQVCYGAAILSLKIVHVWRYLQQFLIFQGRPKEIEIRISLFAA